MDIAFIWELYIYDRCANGKILAPASRLDEERFTRQLGAEPVSTDLLLYYDEKSADEPLSD